MKVFNDLSWNKRIIIAIMAMVVVGTTTFTMSSSEDGTGSADGPVMEIQDCNSDVVRDTFKYLVSNSLANRQGGHVDDYEVAIDGDLNHNSDYQGGDPDNITRFCTGSADVAFPNGTSGTVDVVFTQYHKDSDRDKEVLVKINSLR